MASHRTRTVIKIVLVTIVAGGIIAFAAKVFHDRALPKEPVLPQKTDKASDVTSLEQELSTNIDDELSSEKLGY